MELRLNIVKAPTGVVPEKAQIVFGQQGGSIGRSADNDWVLPDPERYVSSHHCIVVFEDGNFFLEDSSTNGTYLDKRHEPIGDGNREVLRTGSRISMGDYELQVVINDQDSSSAAMAALEES